MNGWLEGFPVAKQTGPGCAVKGAKARTLAGLVAAGVLLASVSGCATTWHNAHKNAREAAADEKACAADAEDTALARSSRQRVDYGRARQNPTPGLNRGETPMQLVERSGTEDTYNREFERCMTSKGYTQDNSSTR